MCLFDFILKKKTSCLVKGLTKITLMFVLLFLCSKNVLAQQDATALFQAIRQRVAQTKDYVADVRMRVDVAFLNIPLLKGTLYFKAPDKMRLERNGGVSVLPRNSINLNLYNIMADGSVTVIDAGAEVLDGRSLRVLKIIPDSDESDVVLTKAWIDESRLLVLRTESTTRDDGTVRMDLEYGTWLARALPDKVTFVLDLKDYKVPKGMTMDYDDGTPAALPQKGKKKKGRIEIQYLNYKINQGLGDEVFERKEKSSRSR